MHEFARGAEEYGDPAFVGLHMGADVAVEHDPDKEGKPVADAGTPVVEMVLSHDSRFGSTTRTR